MNMKTHLRAKEFTGEFVMKKKITSAIIAAVSAAVCITLTGCAGGEKEKTLQLSPEAAAEVAAQAMAANPGGAQAPEIQADEDAADAKEQQAAQAPAAYIDMPAQDEAGAAAPDQTVQEAGAPAPSVQERQYTSADYEAAGVNELNSVPIMMYHRIYDITNDETDYTGGNVDEDGYNRTWEAFENDLESYYAMGYRCMRLTDYIDGNIDVPFGYSPVILTFDDGRSETAIDGFDEDGNPIFKPHSALGVLEKIKKKYPDFNVTATFFLNEFIFDDIDSYEDKVKVLKWMVNNGYDIGNHTMDHPMLEDCTAEEIEYQVGGIYKMLEELIPGQYVNIVALPYGAPTNVQADPKYEKILSGTYDGMPYTTKATLLCSWTRQYSPFVTEWDPTYIRRIRAYDKENATSYYETLRVYSLCLHNKEQTANQLHVHRNTLLYRINRIVELFDLPVEESRTALYLMNCFQLLEAMGAC